MALVIITAINHGLDLAHSYGHRSPGVHMSEIYGDLYAQLEPDRYGKKPGDTTVPMERWGVGMALEEMLEEGLQRRAFNTVTTEQVIRPGEFETLHTPACTRPRELRTKGCGCKCGGGVLYTPDLFITSMVNDISRIGEIKLNSMSAKGLPWKLGQTYDCFDPKVDKYVCQLKSYCKHIGTLYGRLYSFSMREMVYFNEPDIFRGWDIEFEQWELDEEWEMLRRHGVTMKILT